MYLMIISYTCRIVDVMKATLDGFNSDIARPAQGECIYCVAR